MKTSALLRRYNSEFAIGIASLLILATGCSPIQSTSVGSLIIKESEKITEATEASKDFVNKSQQAIVQWQKSVSDIDKALQILRTEESKHALIFKSSQNLSTKTGVDAHAATYLIGELYLNDTSGLERTVKDQFERDFEALKALSQKIEDSWKSLGALQSKVKAYSEATFVAGLDRALIDAVVTEATGDTEGIEPVLKNAKKVNKILEQASGVGGLNRIGVVPAQSFTQDLIKLLDQ